MENIRIIKKEEINSEALKTGYRFKVITEGKKQESYISKSWLSAIF